MKSGAKGAGLDDAAERDAVGAPEGVGEGERSGNMKGTRPGDDGRELLGYGRFVSAQAAAAPLASTPPSPTVGTDASGLLRDEIRRLRLHVDLLQQGQARPSLDVATAPEIAASATDLTHFVRPATSKVQPLS